MNTAQRNLLAKTLADIAKGAFIAVLVALPTGKMHLWVGLLVAVGAVECYVMAHKLLAGGDHHD